MNCEGNAGYISVSTALLSSTADGSDRALGMSSVLGPVPRTGATEAKRTSSYIVCSVKRGDHSSGHPGLSLGLWRSRYL